MQILTPILSTFVPFSVILKINIKWEQQLQNITGTGHILIFPPAFRMLTLLSHWLSLSKHQAFQAEISTSRQQVDLLYHENPVSSSTAFHRYLISLSPMQITQNAGEKKPKISLQSRQNHIGVQTVFLSALENQINCSLRTAKYETLTQDQKQHFEKESGELTDGCVDEEEVPEYQGGQWLPHLMICEKNPS